MPPRIPLIACLKAQASPAPPTIHRAFSTTPTQLASTATQRKKHRDPYSRAQAKARKAANLSRQAVLKQERAQELGDPIRGIETPFVRSFDEPEKATDADKASKEYNNFFLDPSELKEGLERSSWLLTPSEARLDRDAAEIAAGGQGLTAEERMEQVKEEHNTASEALRRIASLSLGSSKDKLRVNTQRCIDTFGRHNTDSKLPPKPVAAGDHTKDLQKAPAAGTDTGSPEVQIAILTAKIKTLADFCETRGKGDSINKRNLRLLVHRRQKLMRYLHKKERGGPRWQNLVDTLGLTDGCWKGEITLGA